MKKLEKPQFDMETIIDNCLVHMQNPRKKRITLVKEKIKKKTEEYDELAQHGQLHIIPEHDTIDNIATKEDMEALYTQRFVPKNQPNRAFYDKILALAPYGKCPYCQQNLVKTVDHFLPKSKYVAYTVTPYNLIPACSDCNTGKLDSTFHNRVEEPFHPYYDNFDDCVWLKAKLIEMDPVSFQFYADPPIDISEEKRQRISHSFSEQGFCLNNIYKLHAAEEYCSRETRLKECFQKGKKELAVEVL